MCVLCDTYTYTQAWKYLSSIAQPLHKVYVCVNILIHLIKATDNHMRTIRTYVQNKIHSEWQKHIHVYNSYSSKTCMYVGMYIL